MRIGTRREKRHPDEFAAIRIDEKEFLSSCHDERLINALGCGRYIIVDGLICLRSSKCLSNNDGTILLQADLAKTRDIRKFFVHYRRSFEPLRYDTGILLEKLFEVFSRKGHTVKMRGGPYFRYLERADDEKREALIQDVYDFFESGTGAGPGKMPPATFSGALSWFMKNRRPTAITEERLAELVGVSSKTIQRYVTGRSTPSLETAVALCVGLNLNPLWALWFVELAKHKLQPYDKTDRLYLAILNSASNDRVTIWDCNDFLVRNGAKPLIRETI